MTGRESAIIAALAFATLFVAFAVGVVVEGHQESSSAPKYEIDKQHSYLLAVTGKSGLFSFAAHRHGVLATEWNAQVEITPGKLAQSSVHITIPVASLVIDSAEARRQAQLDSGPSAGDVRTIQQRMLSPEVLDPQKYPTIEFRSTGIQVKSPGELRLMGEFTLHGKSQAVEVPVRYQKSASGGYTFEADFNIRQTDFGMKPVTVAGGAVKVKDEMKIVAQLSLVPAK